MALGMFGVDDASVIGTYHTKLKERHAGYLDCSDLLRVNKERGREKKPHCDDMVFECVELVEAILKDKGKL